MTSLPWQYPVEPEGGWPPGESPETITVEAAPNGWVAVCVGPYDGYLPPDKVEEFIAAVRAAAAESTTAGAVEPLGEPLGEPLPPVALTDTRTELEQQVAEMLKPFEPRAGSQDGGDPPDLTPGGIPLR